MHSQADDVFEKHLQDLKDKLTEQLHAAGIHQKLDAGDLTQQLSENENQLLSICRDFYHQTKQIMTGEFEPILEKSAIDTDSSYAVIIDSLHVSPPSARPQTPGLSDVIKTFQSKLKEQFPNRAQILENLTRYGSSDRPLSFTFFNDLFFPKIQKTIENIAQVISTSVENSWAAAVSEDIRLYHQLLQAIKSNNRSQIELLFTKQSDKVLALMKTKGHLALDYALETKSYELIACLIQNSGENKAAWMEILIDKNRAKPRIDQSILENIAFINDINIQIFRDSVSDDFQFNHHGLIRCGKKLGYFFSDEGICQGFTMRWIEATILKQQTRFLNRTLIIQQLNRLFDEGQTLEQLETQPEWKDILWEIKAFYESIYLYLDQFTSSYILNTPVFQSDIGAIAEIAAAEDIKQEHIGGIMSSAVLRYDEFSQRGIQRTLEQLEEKIKTCKYGDPVSFIVSCKSEKMMHAINVTYEPKTETWHWMDINEPMQAPRRLNELTNFTGISTEAYFQEFNTFCIYAVLPKKGTESLETSLNETIKLHDTSDIHRDQSILFQASFEGDLEVVKALLDKGTPHDQAENDFAFPLIMAAQNNHLKVVEALLERGADANQAMSDGTTSLYIAAQEGYVGIVKALLNEGAELNHYTPDNPTPLYIAACNGNVGVVEALLDKNADHKQAISDGSTPLLIAVKNGHLQIVEALLKHGADPNLAEENGVTPLLFAAQNGELEIVNALLTKGANPNLAMKDASASTPLTLAEAQGHHEIVEALRLHLDPEHSKVGPKL